MDGESDYLDSWLQRRILRQVQEMLPSLVDAELARRAAEAATLIGQGVCVCNTCGSVLSAHLNRSKRTLTVADVVRLVAAEFGITERDILSTRLERRFTTARHVAMWLAVRALSASQSLLGRVFHRDHTSVAHALRATEKRMVLDGDFAANVARLRRDIEAALLHQAPAITLGPEPPDP